MDELLLRIEPADSPAATTLIAALDRDLMARNPGEPVNGIDAAGFAAAGGVFVIGSVGGEPAACGAFRPFGAAAEIKRVFVAPAWRGRGFGRQVLAELERLAYRAGYRLAILETGDTLVEAIGLYGAAGWTPRPTFGAYVGDPRSRCFEKRLSG